jgi:hypothetical protein
MKIHHAISSSMLFRVLVENPLVPRMPVVDLMFPSLAIRESASWAFLQLESQLC